MGTLTSFDTKQLTQDDVQQLEALASKVSSDSALRVLINTILSAESGDQPLEILLRDAVLSPNKAAELIGMSRPFLLRFIRNGDLKSHKVGTHQKILYSDLMDFQNRREQAQKEVHEALTAPQTSYVADFSDTDLEELDEL